MSLSKQLYLIISILFFMIFTGNFIISVNNTKEYLEIESSTKAQDTATSIGMTLKPLIADKTDSEIETTIKAIANRGFYKEIRLEDIEVSFKDSDLINNSIDDLRRNENWIVSNVTIDLKYGTIKKENSETKFESALENLDSIDSIDDINTNTQNNKYIFEPKDKFAKDEKYEISFTVSSKTETIKSKALLSLNKTLVREYREEKFDYVPQWFVDIIKLDMTEKSSDISDGWNTAATIYVSANAGDAYAKLYEQVQSAIMYSIIAFIISFAILIIFLQFILKPLKNIEKLAVNIANGKFDTIKKLPYTTEIKNVAIAMNDMSGKIEGIIKKLNNNIDNITKKISIDGLTKLQMRQTFETDMKNMFIQKTNGHVMSLKLEELGEFAKNNTITEVDNFIKVFAQILNECNDEMSFKTKAYRFFGSEFAIISESSSTKEVEILVNHLKAKFDKMTKEFKLQNISNIGVTMFNQIGTIPEMINIIEEAREYAKQIGPNEAFIRDEKDLARDMDEWRDLIFDIIDNHKFNVGYIGDAHILSGEYEGKLIMQEAFTKAYDNKGHDIPIGTFISIAEKYHKVIDFDKAVITNIIKNIKEHDIKHNISINLSLDSIIDTKFIEWLKTTLQQNETYSAQLVFSITAYGVAKDIEHFNTFVKIIKKYNAKIVIKRFESKFIPLEKIKDMNLDYIRLARDYTNGISQDSGKHAFVESMQDLCNLVNIKVMAETIKSDEDFEIIKKLELYAASR